MDTLWFFVILALVLILMVRENLAAKRRKGKKVEGVRSEEKGASDEEAP